MSNSGNYIISLINNVVETIIGLDFSNSDVVNITNYSLEDTQNWVNNISENVILEDLVNYNIVDTIDLKFLKSEVFNFRLPSINVIHNMSLLELTEYEVILIDFMDNDTFNVHLNVNILLHLKIITNHFIYKFNIFQ
jgi:hypothetical protein